MAGFKKAKAEQAAIKLAAYGPPGSGKTFSALLWAEGLAKLTGKRVAFVDTEHGSDFYTATVKERQYHPDAFDFDSIYTRSITEVSKEVMDLNTNEYGVLVLDSVTHLWEAAILAYSGKQTSIGTIPFHAWAKIKKPYKALITFLLNSPLHVFILGRQGNEFDNDEESGELRKVGVKMKSEGETPYEPAILLRMEAVKVPKSKVAIITAFAEKDRTGVLAGKTIEWPTYDNTIKPLVALLGGKQAQIQDSDESANIDAEALEEADLKKAGASEKILKEYSAKIALSQSPTELKTLGKEITPALKKQMLPSHVSELRTAYLEREKEMGEK